MDNIRMEQKTSEWSRTRRRKKAWQRVLAGMMAIVVFTTTYALILPAITREQQTFCGNDEHIHGESCYEAVLICGYPAEEEGSALLLGGSHAAQAYEGEEDADAYVSSDTTQAQPVVEEKEEGGSGSGAFDFAEGNGGSEGERASSDAARDDSVNSDDSVNDAAAPHVHSEACYELRLKCEHEEHSHSLACFSDPEADMEGYDTWAASVSAVTLTGDWAADLVAIAESQLGQGESSRNFVADPDGTVHGRTRFGTWWGTPYDPWCAMFVSFCLDYARVDKELMPQAGGTVYWVDTLKAKGLWRDAADYTPLPGDLIFFDYDKDLRADHVGLVTRLDGDKLTSIEGNHSEVVAKFDYARNDESILGYGALPENPDPGVVAELAERSQSPAEAEAELVVLTAVADGVTVTMTGPKTSLPWAWEELELRVVPIEDEAAVALIEGETETAAGAERQTLLFDITIWHNGVEVQPLGPVEVSFAGIRTPNSDARAFYVDDARENVEELPLDQDLTMTTDHFTIYGVTWTVGDIADDYIPGKGVLSDVRLLSTKTGTAPWDGDNAAGNDMSADNEFIRSYDTIFYNVGYTLNLVNAYSESVKGYKKAKLYLRAELPLTADKAEFDLDAMGWLADAAVSGTDPQVLTGYYQASASGDADYALPGEGSLRLAVYVKGMGNDDPVPGPRVELWLDDGAGGARPTNASLIKETTGPSATVRAATVKDGYNVAIQRVNGTAASIDTGTTPWTLNDSIRQSRTEGELITYALSVSRTNDGGKGIKGADLSGRTTVSFALRLKGSLSWIVSAGGALQTGYNWDTNTGTAVTVWDYLPVAADPAMDTGALGRDTTFVAASAARNYLPYSSLSEGTADNAVADSQLQVWAPDSGSDRNVRVSFSFAPSVASPRQTASGASLSSDRIYLASGVVQLLVPYTDLSPSWYNYYLVYDSMEIFVVGDEITVDGEQRPDANAADNRLSAEIWHYIKNSGSFGYTHYLYAESDGASVAWSAGTGAPGDIFLNVISTGGGYPMDAGYFYLYFDPTYLEVDPTVSEPSRIRFWDGTRQEYVSLSGVQTYISYLDGYPALNQHFSAFHNAGTVSGLKALGYTACCVRLSFSGRVDFSRYGVYPEVRLRIREDAPSHTGPIVEGHAALIYSHAKLYYRRSSDNGLVGKTVGSGFTWNGPMANNPVVYDVDRRGITAWTFDEDGVCRTQPPLIWRDSNVYPGGTYTNIQDQHYREHVGSCTVFVRGLDVSVGAEILSPAHASGNAWLQKDERAVDFVLTPDVENYGGSTPSPTTVTVTQKLPAGLKYTPGSAVLGLNSASYNAPGDRTRHGTVTGGYPLADNATTPNLPVCSSTDGDVSFTITENADGSSTLTWTLNNVTPGADHMAKLYFGADIGDASDPAREVADGTVLTATATIQATGSAAASDDASVTVHKLDSATMVKKVKHDVVKVGEPIVYALEYVNDSGNVVDEVTLRDVLPFNGDARGSSFSAGSGHGYTTSVTVVPLNTAAGSADDWSVTGANIANPGAYLDDPFSYTGTITNQSFRHSNILEIRSKVPVQPYAKLRIEVTLTPNGNARGDVYYNDIAMRSSISAAVLKTAVVSAKVVDADLRLVKVDADDASLTLPGAVFTLVGKSDNHLADNGSGAADDVNETSLPTGSDGVTTLTHIPVGEYTLTEITPPDNYKTQPLKWFIEVERDGRIYATPTGGARTQVPATGLVVENVLDGVTLSVTKKVDDASTTDFFKFTLALKDSSSQPLTGLSTTGVVVKNGSGADVTSQADLRLNAATGVYSFRLKHDWTIEFPAVVIGAKATLTETGHDGYTVLIKPGTGTQTVGESAEFTVNTETRAVTVTNTHGEVLPHTGGSGTFLNTSFGLAIMAATVVCGLLRRRRERGVEA